MNSAAVESAASENYPGQLVAIPASGGSITARIWSHLLWKEARQLAFFFGFALVLVSSVQIAILALIQIDRKEFLDSAYVIYNAAFFSPLIFLLGVVAVSISIERDSGTWLWNSCLPVSWWMSLLTKLIVGLLGSALCLACSLGFSVVLLRLLGLTPERLNSMQFWPTLIPLALATLQGLPILCTFVFLIREPANGLIFGTIAALIVEVLRVNLPYVYMSGASIPISAEADWSLYSRWALIVLMTLSAVWIYRWRWRHGMFSDVLSIDRWQRFGAAEKSVALAWTGQASGDYQSMGWLSLRQNFFYLGMLLLCSAAALGLLLSGRRDLGDLGTGLLWVMIVNAALLGLFGFAGDQTKNRYLFLAERGVSPAAIWWMRFVFSVAIPVLVVFFTGLVIWQSQSRPARVLTDGLEVLGACSWVCGLISISLLAGLTIRSWLLACFAVGLFVVLMTPVLVLQAEGSGVWGAGLTLSLPILALPVSHYLVPKWLTYDRVKLGGYFCAFFLALVAVNLAAYPVLRVYSVPSVRTDLGTPLPLPISGFTNLNNVPFDLQNLSSLAVQVRFESQKAEGDLPADADLQSFSELSQWNEFVIQPEQPFSDEENQRLRDLLRSQAKPVLQELELALAAPELAASQLAKSDLIKLARCQQYLGELALISIASGDQALAKRAFTAMHALYDRNPGLWALEYTLPQAEFQVHNQLLLISGEQWRPFLEAYEVDDVCPDRSSQRRIIARTIRGLSSYDYRDGDGRGELDNMLDKMYAGREFWSYSWFEVPGSSGFWWEISRRKREVAYAQDLIDKGGSFADMTIAVRNHGLPASELSFWSLSQQNEQAENTRMVLRQRLLAYQSQLRSAQQKADSSTVEVP